MTDLFDIENMPAQSVATQKKEQKEYSVSELSVAIKRVVEGNFSKIRVKGEIIGITRANSGHIYLSLKDENAVISAIIWKYSLPKLNIKPEDGMEVIATGKVTTYQGRSTYQLIIEDLEIAGVGALLKLLEERKKQFAKEGLFDEDRKQKIPYLPETIGVVTSPSGAVIRDIWHRICDRFPRKIVLWPAPVQGEGAEVKIAEAIKGLNNLPEEGFINSDGEKVKRPDVIIVARGGGSLEDLWAFNEEAVVRAVSESQIPVISAVGHETDTMLIDYVSDLRAPTPTGAAELAVPVREEVLAWVKECDLRLSNNLYRFLEEKKNYINGLRRGLPNLTQILADFDQKLDDRLIRFNSSFNNYLSQLEYKMTDIKPYLVNQVYERNNDRFKNLVDRLEASSIDNTLKRGFVWVRDNDGNAIMSSKDIKPKFEMSFYDGNVKAELQTDMNSVQTAQKPAPKKRNKRKEIDDKQGSLF